MKTLTYLLEKQFTNAEIIKHGYMSDVLMYLSGDADTSCYNNEKLIRKEGDNIILYAGFNNKLDNTATKIVLTPEMQKHFKQSNHPELYKIFDRDTYVNTLNNIFTDLNITFKTAKGQDKPVTLSSIYKDILTGGQGKNKGNMYENLLFQTLDEYSKGNIDEEYFNKYPEIQNTLINKIIEDSFGKGWINNVVVKQDGSKNQKRAGKTGNIGSIISDISLYHKNNKIDPLYISVKASKTFNYICAACSKELQNKDGWTEDFSSISTNDSLKLMALNTEDRYKRACDVFNLYVAKKADNIMKVADTESNFIESLLYESGEDDLLTAKVEEVKISELKELEEYINNTVFGYGYVFLHFLTDKNNTVKIIDKREKSDTLKIVKANLSIPVIINGRSTAKRIELHIKCKDVNDNYHYFMVVLSNNLSTTAYPNKILVQPLSNVKINKLNKI